MAPKHGWVRDHRSILDWEWYHDIPVFRLFHYIRLVANYEDAWWKGILVKRGQLITSRESLAEATDLTQKQVRGALEKLVRTREIAIATTNRFSVITVAKYDYYNPTMQL